MNFPSDLKYSREHEWVRVEGNNGYIGITDFAQKELGESYPEAFKDIYEFVSYAMTDKLFQSELAKLAGVGKTSPDRDSRKLLGSPCRALSVRSGFASSLATALGGA